MWAYETKTIEVKKDLTREQQLDIRQKMIKDKHCWWASDRFGCYYHIFKSDVVVINNRYILTPFIVYNI